MTASPLASPCLVARVVTHSVVGTHLSGEALRLQEQRLEQALRLHGDPRALSFTLAQHVVNQQSNQQP